MMEENDRQNEAQAHDIEGTVPLSVDVVAEDRGAELPAVQHHDIGGNVELGWPVWDYPPEVLVLSVAVSDASQTVTWTYIIWLPPDQDDDVEATAGAGLNPLDQSADPVFGREVRLGLPVLGNPEALLLPGRYHG